jgi:hypothetical protein
MAITLTPAQQTALNNTYNAKVVNALNTGKLTSEQLDIIKADAKTAGAVIPAATLTRANTSAVKNDAAAVAAKQTALNNEYKNQLLTALNTGNLTMSQFNSIIADAEKAGAVIDSGTVTNASKSAVRNETLATAAKQIALNNEYKTKLITAAGSKGGISQVQLDQIVADAKAAGANIDSNTVATATAAAQRYEAAAPQRAAAQEAVKKAILGAGTTAEITNQVNIARADGVTIDPGIVEQATARIKAVELGKQFQPELAKATTQAELDAIKSRAETLGAKLDQGYVDQAQQGITTAVKAAEAKTAAEAKATAQANWQQQAQSAATPEQAQQIIDQARAAGQWDLNDATTNSYVTGAQARVEQQQRATASAVKAQELAQQQATAKAASLQKAYDYASKLAPPTQAQNTFTQDGRELVGVPDDPTTEANEAGWYVLDNNQLQRVGADAKPIGGPVAPDVLQESTNQIRTNTQAYELQQQAETANQAALLLATNVTDFESQLPTPAEFMASGAQSNILRGPDGSDYFLTAANAATGATPEWVKMDPNMGGITRLSTGQVQSTADYNQEYTATQESNRQVEYQREVDRATRMREDRENTFSNFIESDFGKLFVLAVTAAVVGPMIGEALTGGATATDVAATATSMAEGGATATEIASAMETAGLSAEAAATVAETATGITNGVIDLEALGAANGITTEAITTAASSADPLIAINETIAPQQVQVQ